MAMFENRRDVMNQALEQNIYGDLIINRDADQAAISLPTVEDAYYNSAADQDIPRCQPGTRVGILNQINAWANDVKAETIFWVCGPAGTGKSTIARSLAYSLADTGRLGASYFFKRGEEGRNGTALFFPTIADQLIHSVPTFRTFLRKSLKKLGNAKAEKKALEEQFKTLILTPLSEIVPGTSGILTRIIVVDALDECEEYNHVSQILSLLSQLQALNPVRLRVFLTSRSTPPIVRAFKDLKEKHARYRCLALDEEFSNETKADISTFLQERFATIKTNFEITEDPWPDPRDLNRLVSLATNPSPLFIYAATLCRFVDDGTGKRRPAKQLELWLKQCDTNVSQLDQIYLPIFRQLFDSQEGGETPNALDEDQSQLQKILGSIALLASPLPVRGLAALLDVSKADLNHWLRNLRAVLNVPGDPNAPVRLLHKSLSDFLLGQARTSMQSFRVDAAKTHAMLGLRCIQRMNEKLGNDICQLKKPGKLRAEIDKGIVADHIPPDLDYACLYWVFHVQQSGRRITDGDKVHIFLKEHFLHWQEALSLTGKMAESNGLISTLQSLITTDESTELSRFLHDARCFTLQNRGLIDMAPLQLYSSAIIFAPEISIVKHMSKEKMPTWIRRLPKMQTTWNPELQKLEGHSDCVSAVAFSRDGQLLASASDDWTVRLWNPATGAELRKLEGHSGTVRAVAFSRDGQLLASASGDRTVRLWNPATGAELRKFDIDVVVYKLSFSKDGLYVKTDKGLLRIQSTHSSIPPSPSKPACDIFLNECWVTRDMENLLWLPPNYRATSSALQGNILVLGHASGQITFLEFSFADT